jgi:hypothetical protein
MPETQFATTLIVCLKAGVALLVSADAVRRWAPAVFRCKVGAFCKKLARLDAAAEKLKKLRPRK